MKEIVIKISDDDFNRIESYRDGHTLYPITARLYKAVKHGKRNEANWVGLDEFPHELYECNGCGYQHVTDDISEFKYCPNCGRRMV